MSRPMTLRKRLIRLLAALLLLVLGWVALIWFNPGGIDRGFAANPDFGWVDAMQGVSCETASIPVRLTPDSRREYRLVGRLCLPEGRSDTTLQVLVSGAGYGIAYWDFPYKPDTYSYARAALRAGDAVFGFDRLGMGLSDHPPGPLLDVDTQAFVLEQTISALRQERDYPAVVTLGHSFGSTVALAHALRFPEQVDGIVLTGFIHNVNPEFGPAIGRKMTLAAFSKPLAGQLFDPTYVITKPGARESAFYTTATTDPRVIATDDATRETTALGELISMSRYFAGQSRALSVPVMVLVGENDSVVCGGALDCTDHEDTIAHELAYYPTTSCPEIYVLDDTNHNANLHRNAREAFALMLDWVARRIGTAGEAPREPCAAGTITTTNPSGETR